MATKIVTKNSSTASAVPTASDLVQGELAVNVADKRLFTEDNGGSIVELGTNPSGNVTFQDNGKAIFGAGSDLQIYHDGSNSYIDDAGTGNLRIRGSQVILEKYTGETILQGIADGSVYIFHDNAEKLATTSTGIDVTGIAKVGSGSFDGGGVQHNYGSDANSRSWWAKTDTHGYGDFALRQSTTKTGSTYETKLLIDASGNVGIGTSSPQGLIDLTVSQAKTSTGGATFAQLGKTNESSGYASLQCEVKGGASAADRKWTFQTIEQGVANAGSIVLQPDGGNVGIGCTPASKLDIDISTDARGSFSSGIGEVGSGNFALQVTNSAGSALKPLGFRAEDIRFATGSSERMRIDSSGNLLVGTSQNNPTSSGVNVAGQEFSTTGGVRSTVASNAAATFNRKTDDGAIALFRKDGTTVGSIGTESGNVFLNSASTGLLSTVGTARYKWDVDQFYPNGDNAKNLGTTANRFDDIYATNGTIQTSDRNEKQDIAELSDAEQRVAVAAKGLLRKFRWKDSVAEKGDEARTHFGIIAQDLQAAFAAEGLDAGDYAMFISSTWTDEETNEEKTRMGVRYSELLAFIISAI